MNYQKIFIVGSPRSGTHWLRRLLATHPEVVNNDYESNVYKIVLGSLIYSRLPWNRSWVTVVKNFDNSHLSHWIPREEFLMQIESVKSDKELKNNKEKGLQLINNIFDGYYIQHKTQRSTALLEKTPAHLNYTNIILDQFKEAKVVEIVRDGRDVLLSLNKLYHKGEKWVPNQLNKRIELWTDAIKTVQKFKKIRFTNKKYLLLNMKI